MLFKAIGSSKERWPFWPFDAFPSVRSEPEAHWRQDLERIKLSCRRSLFLCSQERTVPTCMDPICDE